MKKTIKRTVSLLLAAVILAGVLTPAVFAAPVSGSCGENLTWTLTADGTMTIEGYGATYDMVNDADDIPSEYDWFFPYRFEIKRIYFPDGITRIGKYLFDSASYCENVYFGENSQLAVIDECAFYNCIRLKSVEIPASVTEIGYGAFFNCTSLNTVTFAADSRLTTIGREAFCKCTALKSIAIPYGVKEIGMLAFAYSPLLESVTIPESVEALRLGAFAHCTGLLSLTVPSSVKTVEAEAFGRYDPDGDKYMETYPGFTLSCYPNSAAQKFAEEYSIACTLLEPRITVSPEASNLMKRRSRQLTATVNPLYAAQEIIWSSSDTSIATVDQNGRVTAVGIGEVEIYATLADTNDTAVAAINCRSFFKTVTDFTPLVNWFRGLFGFFSTAINTL